MRAVVHRVVAGGVFTAAGAGVKTNLLFFTRGKPTEKIWYYDLSERKVGKKNPLVLDDFKEFFALLSSRGDSDRSWTVDFPARRRQAADEARPFRKTEAEKKAEADALKTALQALKKAEPIDETKIAETEAALDAALKAGREAAKKAESIEKAIYDLKAVNPHRKVVVDSRTPAELLDFIDAKGAEVAASLALLRKLNAH
jgi:type I restriction enzyme M protein